MRKPENADLNPETRLYELVKAAAKLAREEASLKIAIEKAQLDSEREIEAAANRHPRYKPTLEQYAAFQGAVILPRVLGRQQSGVTKKLNLAHEKIESHLQPYIDAEAHITLTSVQGLSTIRVGALPSEESTYVTTKTGILYRFEPKTSALYIEEITTERDGGEHYMAPILDERDEIVTEVTFEINS